MSHLYLSAAHKSSGKTSLSIGLCAAWRKQGLQVQPFKKGPDYIDPLWMTAASGRPCINLDFHTMGPKELHYEFVRRMQGADLGLIEGNKGLFDGVDLHGTDSNAALAVLLSAPVVLVLDTSGMTRGVAPLLLGYQDFDDRLKISGVILNKVGGPRHESKLRAVIEHYTAIPVVGAVQRSSELEIDERHLGLVPSNEATQASAKIDTLAEAIADQVDLAALRAIADRGPAPAEIHELPLRRARDLRIGIARDRAFGFYYPGDLEALEANGAELVEFDCLRDPGLPRVDGLFIGGGFPETVMDGLESNRQLRTEIRSFIEGGGPVYAECGGMMYLCRELRWGEQRAEMVGAIPAAAVMHDRPQGRGYVQLRETAAAPWPPAPGWDPQRLIHGHEFHYSSLEDLEGEPEFAYEVIRGQGIDGRRDGLVYKNLLACYSHLRDVGANHWTRRFLDKVRQVRAS